MNTKDYIMGKEDCAYEFFGAHKHKNGYIFRIYAPKTENVYISGDFNQWNETKLRKYSTGVHTVTIKNAKENDRYLFILEKNGKKIYKLDPYSFKIDKEDDISSVIYDKNYKYKYKKPDNNKPIRMYQLPINVFCDTNYDFKTTVGEIINRIKNIGYNCLLLFPVCEYLNKETLGYKVLSFFSITDQINNIEGLNYIIDQCHRNKIRVFLDIDISQFDDHFKGLNKFDDNLYNYDYEDILYNYYNSINLDMSKSHVKSFLNSLADYYTKKLRVDGIRVNAIENLIYWQGDKNRNYNEAAIDVLKSFIRIVHKNNSEIIIDYNYDDDLNNLELDHDLLMDYSPTDLVKVFQNKPYDRDKLRFIVENFLEKDFNEKIGGCEYKINLDEGCSSAMKMYGDDYKMKFEQYKTFMSLIKIKFPNEIISYDSELMNFNPFSIYKNNLFERVSSLHEKFFEYYKDLVKLSDKIKLIKDYKLLEVDGYSLYILKLIDYKEKEHICFFNLTDISYEISSEQNYVELLNTQDLKYDGSGNVNGKISKGELIIVEAYSTVILKKSE